jgi:hypothetical protein
MMEIQADNRPSALADEGKARQSIACLDPLEAEALYSSAVREFYRTGAESGTGNERIAQWDSRCGDDGIGLFGILRSLTLMWGKHSASGLGVDLLGRFALANWGGIVINEFRSRPRSEMVPVQHRGLLRALRPLSH